MVLLLIGLAALGAYLTAGSAFFIPAVVNAVASFCANGVLANFSRDDPDEAPNWAAAVSMITAVAAVVFIIVGIVIR